MSAKMSFYRTFEESLFAHPELTMQISYDGRAWSVLCWEGKRVRREVVCVSRKDRKPALEAAALRLLEEYPPRYSCKRCDEAQAVELGLSPLTEMLNLEEVRRFSAQMGEVLHYIVEPASEKGQARCYQIWGTKVRSCHELRVRSIQRFPDEKARVMKVPGKKTGRKIETGKNLT